MCVHICGLVGYMAYTRLYACVVCCMLCALRWSVCVPGHVCMCAGMCMCVCIADAGSLDDSEKQGGGGRAQGQPALSFALQRGRWESGNREAAARRAKADARRCVVMPLWLGGVVALSLSCVVCLWLWLCVVVVWRGVAMALSLLCVRERAREVVGGREG